jgi:hypothetical protein
MEFFTKRKKITTKWNPPQNQDWMSWRRFRFLVFASSALIETH